MTRWHSLAGVLLVLLLLPAAASALSLGDILSDGRVEDAVSVAILLSDDAAEQIVSTLGSAEVEKRGICRDPALTSRADRIFRRVAGADRQGYTLKVLNDSVVNAYAVLGGHLYLNRGLLAVPGITDDEIAAVIGHELTHLRKRHGLHQVRQAMVAGFVAGKLTPKGKQGALAVLAGQLWVSGRSQKDEREADLLGASLARAAGYRATGAVAFMRRMEVMTRNERSRHPGGSALLAALEPRLASHPPTSERCEYLKDDLFVSAYGQDFRLAETKGDRVQYTSLAHGRDSVLLQQTPVHIGDDQAGISTIWSKPFDLTDADLAGRTAAKVVFLLRSTEIRRDPNVCFNRVHVGFAVTRSRTWERFEFDVPLTALHPGQNLVDIETIIPDLWRTYDDCEFRDVKLLLSGRQPSTPFFIRPTRRFQVSTGFGDDWLDAYRCVHGELKKHVGLDIDPHQAREEVVASAAGTVQYAGVFDRQHPAQWGDLVIVESDAPSGGKVTASYGHIVIDGELQAAFDSGRTVTVKQGSRLGVIDPAVSTPHLHFGLRFAPYHADLSKRGALPACGKKEADPQFPEHWRDPREFIK